MKRLINLLIVFLLILTGCTESNDQIKRFDPQKTTELLEYGLHASVADPSGKSVKSASLLVDFPEADYLFTGAEGIGREDTGEKMTTEHQFFISSVGKTFTACIIMQLYEEGAFGEKGLDASLGELALFSPKVLNVLHRKDGVSYGGEITVRQLLNHTTGLKNVDNDSAEGIGDDYPETMGYAPGSLNYIDVYDKSKGLDTALKFINEGIPEGGKLSDYYLFQPLPEWDYDAWLADSHDKMAGQLNFFLNGANENALFKPGESMYYSDTNYLVLGLLIEKLTGKSLDEVKNERIFRPLGMTHTYLNDAAAAQNRKYRLSDYWAAGLPLVSLGIDLSRTDRGDGGEITTLSDLNTFIRALANGKLFRNSSTLDEMLKLPFGGDFGYADGVVYAKTDAGAMLSHNGSSGAWMEYYSKYDLSVVGTVNEIDPERMMGLRAAVFDALHKGGLEAATFRYGPAAIRLLFTVESQPPAAPLIALLGSSAVLLSALIVWFIILFLKWRKESKNKSAGSGSRNRLAWLADTSAILNLIFIIALTAVIAGNSERILITGYTPLLVLLLVLPKLSCVLTVITAAAAILAWKNRNRSADARMSTGAVIYCSVIAIASVVFLVSLQLTDLLF
jgi:D-alanyl-D-alanine carboxypeptidase